VSAVGERIAFATGLSEQAGEIALRWFRMSPEVTNKAKEGMFDPVTAADHAVEEFLRTELVSRFPDDGFFGEESGRSGGIGPFRWVVDPVDGTRAFISGNPLWGILIGLEESERAVGGVVRTPALGETFLGDGERAWMRSGEREQRLCTSRTAELSHATLCSTAPDMFAPGDEADAFNRLSGACRLTRWGGDCYSYCLLAMGHVDLVVEAGLQPYDIVALAPIIRGAGGVVATADGGPAERGGFIVAAANEALHGQALSALRVA
jgi:myo-inositol-1(or 4)-monophosphatase